MAALTRCHGPLQLSIPKEGGNEGEPRQGIHFSREPAGQYTIMSSTMKTVSRLMGYRYLQTACATHTHDACVLSQLVSLYASFTKFFV
ncbi:hypothetical protein ZEAMMB73_Zm00001d044198 [Zea mays]|uniref:Uncharacterized protein n=1 Tax=Zea mays TaxID=4577 RepID=A0A1D6NJI0_MAIZE|nr:hypothetical protein ZEAMMB73_Zm00001d044198 [Zea mays]